jgi:hypothetical protein
LPSSIIVAQSLVSPREYVAPAGHGVVEGVKSPETTTGESAPALVSPADGSSALPHPIDHRSPGRRKDVRRRM